MIGLLLRVLGWLLLAGGFVALVVDGTQSIAADALRWTPFGQHLAQLLGARFAAIQPAVERNLSPLLWDPVLARLFQVPSFVVLVLAGSVLILASGRRPPPIGHSSRP